MWKVENSIHYKAQFSVTPRRQLFRSNSPDSCYPEMSGLAVSLNSDQPARVNPETR
jgi:hypothetical protein